MSEPTDHPSTPEPERRTGPDRRSGYERRAEQREQAFHEEVARIVGEHTEHDVARYGRETRIGNVFAGPSNRAVELAILVERDVTPDRRLGVMVYMSERPLDDVLVLLRPQAQELARLLLVGVGVLDQVGEDE